MQSALVRRDAVMLNDPMRTHTRATIVGVVLGMLGMLGFVIWGLLSPKPTVPDAGNIVIGEQSGTVYVVAGNPTKLIPTFNLASARLILMAQSQQGQQSGQAGAQGGAAPAVKDATVVSDEQLKDIPRTKLTGIPDGPQLLPDDKQRIPANWSVCDEIGLDPSLPNPASINKHATTVLAGVTDLGRELAVNEALLAKADNGKEYLIYRLLGSPNQPNANAVRAEIDLSTTAVASALQLQAAPRHISQGLLNAIPEVTKITPPVIAGAGGPAPSLAGFRVGDVFATSPAGGNKEHWVITQTGIQRISEAVADIIRSAKSEGDATIKEVPLDQMQGVKSLVAGDPGYLAVEDYPAKVPTVLEATSNPVSCLGWSLRGEGTAQDVHTAVYIGTQVPGPKDQAIPMSSVNPDGSKIDKFYMQPGFAAVVQSATSKETFGKGPIQLISDRGLRYGVPDTKTADGLGLNKRLPAPESIIRLLPTGASLNTRDVVKTFDSVPIDPKAGAFPSVQPQAAPAGGN